MNGELIPFAEYWWLYAAFGALVAVLLAIDLTFHRKAHIVSFREAAAWTAVWVTLALAFCGGLYLFAAGRLSPEAARRLSLEFLTGYIVEESLSIDNMFVFALIFQHFAVRPQYQHRVLFYGVLGAMICRGVFIAIGSALIRFEWVLFLFGVVLIVTGVRMAFQEERSIDPERSPVVRWAARFLPTTPRFDGGRFTTSIDGRRYFTPLMIVLLLLESTDIVFAIDSVPAVFAVTREPFVVYTSNIFAILGLRALYFVLAGALDRFHLLRYGLAVVLVFIGLKLTWLDHLAGGRFPILASLAVIGVVIGASVVGSLLLPPGRGIPRPSARCVQRLIGCVCLLLAAASLLFATGVAHAWSALPALRAASPASLYVSALGYALCGAVLILYRRAATPPRGR